MKVKFKNRFHVPGFDRKRFPKGEVVDVPEALREHLPSTAEILDEDYKEEEQLIQEDEDLRAHDYARAASDTGDAALEQAGLAGFADASAEVEEAVEEDAKPSRGRKKG